MRPINKLFVCVTIMFSLYFMGVLNIILQLTYATMPDFSSVVTIKEVPEPEVAPATNPLIEETQGIYNKMQETIEKKKNEMSAFMQKVVGTMEELLKDVDADNLNEKEKWDTLTDLYQKFPVMEKVFEKALAMESTLGNDPTQHKDTQKRLASVKKILEDSKETIVRKIKEKGTSQETLDKFEKDKKTLNGVSSKTESENNISEAESKINININEKEDSLKRINVNQNENVHTEF